MGYRISAFEPRKTALLVIDMQNDFLCPGAPLETPAGRELVPLLRDTIATARQAGVAIIYTAHVHRRDGCDMGRFRDIYPPIAAGRALIDEMPGVDIYPECAPQPGDLLIKKHRYSGFFQTDLEMILRGRGIDTVAVAGVTTEDCVHATARDAMFRDFHTTVLSDCCATYDHPDLGQGAMSWRQVHQATLVVLAQSTADVRTAREFTAALGA